MSEFWDASILSVEVSLCATAVALAAGLPAAHFLARRKFWGKSAVEAALMVPLVLPPTVVGYLLLLAFGSEGWITHTLLRLPRYSIAFRFEGAVFAAAVVAFPLLYLPAKAGFAGIDRELEDVARVFGANRWQRFWHVTLPGAWRSVASGMILAFARALGEFGATVIVYGMRPGKYTLPITLYMTSETSGISEGLGVIAALVAVSFGLIVAYNWTLGKRGG
jgi:molybdate transport system permease protein